MGTLAGSPWFDKHDVFDLCVTPSAVLVLLRLDYIKARLIWDFLGPLPIRQENPDIRYILTDISDNVVIKCLNTEGRIAHI